MPQWLLLMAALLVSACPVAGGNATTTCLHYLQAKHKDTVCQDNTEDNTLALLRGLRLKHCCHQHVLSAVAHDAVLKDTVTCRRTLDDLIRMDGDAGRAAAQHAETLDRYDCGQSYSIAHNCEDCKEAYKRWVCSALVPYYSRSGQRIRPCLRVCQSVEQKCPYLLPGDWANYTLPPGVVSTINPPPMPPQYAGEPTFLCLDTNIPMSGEQRRRSTQGDEDCCYTHCGSSGRGMEVCEHCPGRPPQAAPSSATPLLAPHLLRTLCLVPVLLYYTAIRTFSNAKGWTIIDLVNINL